VFGLFQFAGVIFLPETPRWLVAQGKRERAERILVKYHGGGDVDSPLVKFEMAEIEAQLEADSMAQSYSWTIWFKTKGNRRRLYIILFFPWARQFTSTNLISFFFPIVLTAAGITDNSTQLELNAGMNMSSFFFAITTNFFIERFNRRTILITFMSICCTCVVVWTILEAQLLASNYTYTGLGYGIVVVVYIFQGMIHIFDASCEPYVQELSTFELRSKITQIWNFGQNVVQLVSSLANPTAMATLGYKYLIIYAVLCATYAVIIYLFFPETRGLSLEECAMIFDGDKAMERQNAAEAEYVGGEKEARSHVENVAGREKRV